MGEAATESRPQDVLAAPPVTLGNPSTAAGAYLPEQGLVQLAGDLEAAELECPQARDHGLVAREVEGQARRVQVPELEGQGAEGREGTGALRRQHQNRRALALDRQLSGQYGGQLMGGRRGVGGRGRGARRD
jgi:hypothetical protein